jgi:hypothetical protein
MSSSGYARLHARRIVFTFGMASMEELYATRTIRLATHARSAFALLTLIGALAAAADRRAGAWALVAGFVGTLAAQLVMGIAGYRRVMSRPWPDVRPLADEDEW